MVRRVERLHSGQDGYGDRQQRPCHGHFQPRKEPRCKAGSLCRLPPCRRSLTRSFHVAPAGGLATTRLSAWSSEDFKKAFGPQAADAALTNLQNADVDRAKAILFHPQSRPIQDAFMIGVNEVVSGAKSASIAMAAAAEKANAAIRG